MAGTATLDKPDIDAPPQGPHSLRRVSAPIAVFAGVELVAVFFWLTIGRHKWFHHDEWDFLAARQAGDLGDLFRPHGPHWVTLPVLLYRAIFSLFGLRAYLPYRIPVLAAHLSVAALLLVVMRRAEVRPWIAVAAAALFVAFGAGAQNIINPFQVAFTAALAFGLTHLLLADHAGRVDARDGWGLLAGLAALMCSGVGVAMVAAVGLAVLLRRGWRIAALHTVPLAIVYLVWLAVIGHKTSGQQSSNPTVGGVIRFVATGERAAYEWIVGGSRPLGLAVVLVLAGGLACAAVAHRRSGTLSRLAAPVALVFGSVVFLGITASGRLFLGVSAARSGRYLYLVAALTLPALAVAADALATLRRWILPVAVALFLIGVPANLRAAVRAGDHAEGATRAIFTSLQADARSKRVPPSIHPEPVMASDVTIGWLAAQAPGHHVVIPARLQFEDRFRLAFAQSKQAAPHRSCSSLEQPLVLRLEAGDIVGLYRNTIVVRPAGGHHLLGPPLVFFPRDGRRIALVASPGRVQIDRGRHPLNWAMHRYNTRLVPTICVERAAGNGS